MPRKKVAPLLRISPQWEARPVTKNSRQPESVIREKIHELVIADQQIPWEPPPKNVPGLGAYKQRLQPPINPEKEKNARIADKIDDHKGGGTFDTQNTLSLKITMPALATIKNQGECTMQDSKKRSEDGLDVEKTTENELQTQIFTAEQAIAAENAKSDDEVEAPLAVDLQGNSVDGIKYNRKTDVLSTDSAPVVPYSVVQTPKIKRITNDKGQIIYDPSYTDALLEWFTSWKPVTVLWIEKTWNGASGSHGINRFPKIVGNPPPRIEKFAILSLRCPPRMLQAWAKEHPELDEALEICHEIYRQAVLDGAILGHYNATWSIFEAKNNLSMADKQEITHKGDATMLAISAHAAQVASMDAHTLTSNLARLLQKADGMIKNRIDGAVKEARFEEVFPMSDTIDAKVVDTKDDVATERELNS